MDGKVAALGLSADKASAKPISLTLISGLFRLFDLSVVALVGYFAFLLYVLPDDDSVTPDYLGSLLIAVLVTAGIFEWSRVYASDNIFTKRLRLERLISAWTIAFSVFLALAFALKISSTYSRVWAVTWFVTVPAVLAVGRFLLSYWIHRLAEDGRFASRTVIVGAGEHGQRLAAHLMAYEDVRTRVIGFIDDRQKGRLAGDLDLEILGDIQHLVRLIQRGLVDQIFVALPWSAERRLMEVIEELATTPVPIRLAPDMVGFELTDRSFTKVARLPMLHVFDRPISGWSGVAKTVEDFVLGVLLFIVVAPLFFLIALAIKIDSPGPVFFRQRRYGFNNNLIEVWKFRTMYADQTDSECEHQTIRNDPRVTRIGEFLRRSSLDELPQLLNVLRGEMSLVGPRPHAVATKAAGRRFEEAVHRYAARHKVKPGITGWAQVNGWRGETDTLEKLQKRVEFDLYYIDNWSILFDLEILIRTLVVVIRDHNDTAY